MSFGNKWIVQGSHHCTYTSPNQFFNRRMVTYKILSTCRLLHVLSVSCVTDSSCKAALVLKIYSVIHSPATDNLSILQDSWTFAFWLNFYECSGSRILTRNIITERAVNMLLLQTAACSETYSVKLNIVLYTFLTVEIIWTEMLQAEIYKKPFSVKNKTAFIKF